MRARLPLGIVGLVRRASPVGIVSLVSLVERARPVGRVTLVWLVSCVVTLAIGLAGCDVAPSNLRASSATTDSTDRGEPTSRESSAIVHGEVATDQPAVVALVARPLLCDARVRVAYCSGTLIAPRVVLTAAHCLEERRAAEIRVFFGADATSPDGAGAFSDVVDAATHPLYDASTGAFDVALLRLATPSSTASITPVEVSQSAAAIDATLVGKLVHLVGFGLDDAHQTGVKREGDAMVSSVDATTFRLTPGPALSCNGDSGGPVFLDDSSGPRLIGVTRSGDDACAELATSIRVDTIVSDFVAPYVAASLDAVSPPIVDTSRDDCVATCESDADCPLAMLCLSEREAGRHCGFSSLQSGRFGEACASDLDCQVGTCLVTGEHACQCFTPCAGVPSGASDGRSSATVEGGGCSASRCRTSSSGAGPDAFALVVLLFVFSRRAKTCVDVRSA